MAIITKKINSIQYAYLVIREGSKINHYYLGRADDPDILKFKNQTISNDLIPSDLHQFFWDTDPDIIRVSKHAKYIIERLLETGNYQSLLWLEKTFSVKKILEILYISRNISDKSKTFFNIWFGDYENL